MPRTQNQAVMKWLFFFTFVVAFLVVFGGFVRLTRSGLSIVEWNPISGSMPPKDNKPGWMNSQNIRKHLNSFWLILT